MSKTKKQIIEKRDKLLKQINKKEKELEVIDKKANKIKRHKLFKKHKKYIGRCYKVSSSDFNFDFESDISTIKVLQILGVCKKQPNYAKCKILYQSGGDISMTVNAINFWEYSIGDFSVFENSDCTRDNCVEITLDEFTKFEKKLLEKFKQNKLKKEND